MADFDDHRGECLSNTWTTERFTCPACLRDHEVLGLSEDTAGEQFRYRRCDCGAPLRFEIVLAPEAKATVMDEDDEEEAIESGDFRDVRT